jgi:hypothetical protein
MQDLCKRLWQQLLQQQPNSVLFLIGHLVGRCTQLSKYYARVDVQYVDHCIVPGGDLKTQEKARWTDMDCYTYFNRKLRRGIKKERANQVRQKNRSRIQMIRLKMFPPQLKSQLPGSS